MTLLEQYNKQIPEYYPSMYLDGYDPYQILHAARRKLCKEYDARKAAQEAEAESDEIPEVKVTSVVKIR